MTQKTALILSAALTAFVLVLGGGIAAHISQSPAAAVAAPVAAPTAAPTTAPAASTPAADVTAQVEQIMQQREAQYRQLIDQANQRLAAMNQQLAAAQAAPSTPARASTAVVSTASAAQPVQPSITLSAEAARNIAINAANLATMIREPELVRFEGKVAYEVGFTRGVIYVDANSGAVLYNGTQGGGSGGQPASQPPAPSGGNEGEHETESHD